MIRFISWIPWQLTLFIVSLSVLVMGLLQIQLPCVSSLFIGLCELGRYLAAFVHLIILSSVFLSTGFILRKTIDRKVRNKSILLVGAIAVVITFLLLMIMYQIHPYNQSFSISGQKRVETELYQFIGMKEVASINPQSGLMDEMHITVSLKVSESGNYTIYPIRMVGLIPTLVFNHEGNEIAQKVTTKINKADTIDFPYIVRIQPLVVSGRNYSQEISEQLQADHFSWKILWRIEEIPPFPYNLFKPGIHAMVYPDDSGEFANITHINLAFKTRQYSRDLFIIE